MATEVVKVDYRYIILDDEAPAAAAALSTLTGLGIGLIGYSEFPHGQGRSQLDLIAGDSEELATKVAEMGLTISGRKSAFLIRGDDDPGVAVTTILSQLAAANVRVTSLQAADAGAGRFGALLWVPQQDVAAAAVALHASDQVRDLVDETSEESFPASDAPSWAMAGSESA